MRRAAKVDQNQAEIVAAFRKLGCTVQPMHMVGGGFPDLVVRYGNHLALVECKNGRKPPSARKLTPDQIAWHQAWGGIAHIVQSVDDVAALVASWRVGL